MGEVVQGEEVVGCGASQGADLSAREGDGGGGVGGLSYFDDERRGIM